LSRPAEWNFTKFLVDKQGNVVERYSSNVKPLSIAPTIEKLLAK
jgi:glutathione peroxidase